MSEKFPGNKSSTKKISSGVEEATSGEDIVKDESFNYLELDPELTLEDKMKGKNPSRIAKLKFEKDLEKEIPNIQKMRFEARDTLLLLFNEMRSAATVLLEQIHEEIERGSYSVLLSEETSARVPTLLFREILYHIYKARGFDTPHTYFFAGLSSTNIEEVTEWSNKVASLFSEIKKYTMDEQHKVLVITEFIARGHSMDNNITALQHAGIPFDVAAFGSSSGPETSDGFPKIKGTPTKMYVGGYEEFEDMRGNSFMSGVYKKKGDVIPRIYDGERERDDRRIQVFIDAGLNHVETKKLVRKIVGIVGKKMAESYLKNHIHST